MRTKVAYEWSIEHVTNDGFFDIAHLDFGDEPELQQLVNQSDPIEDGLTTRLVLVANWGSDDDGLIDRAWAYLKDDKLDTHFRYCDGSEVRKVPVRFHRAIDRVSFGTRTLNDLEN